MVWDPVTEWQLVFIFILFIPHTLKILHHLSLVIGGTVCFDENMIISAFYKQCNFCIIEFDIIA